MKTIGYRIKMLRDSAGITQKELAEKLDVDVVTVRRYEQDKTRPDAYALVRLATFFGVSTDYILGIGGLKKQQNEMVKYGGDWYKKYLLCREKYTINEELCYYWINSENNQIGGQTEWIGFTDTEPKREIRKLRYVEPQKAIELCTEVYGKPIVINKLEDIEIFLIYGGNAIIRADICEKYLPNFLKPFYV